MGMGLSELNLLGLSLYGITIYEEKSGKCMKRHTDGKILLTVVL